MLLDRCKLSQRFLDMKDHRAVASHSCDFSLQDDLADAVTIQSLLHNFPSYHWNFFALANNYIADIRFRRIDTHPQRHSHYASI